MPRSPSLTRTHHTRHPPCRLKLFCVCLAIAAVPCYVVTLLLIGKTASHDQAIQSSMATTHPLLSGTGNASLPPSRDGYRAVAKDIAARWNLTSAEAPSLLEQQFYRVNDYNPATDFLHFHHIPKTGGTTLSDILNATLGALAEGNRGILPGSERSGPLRAASFYSGSGIPPNRSTAEGAYFFPHLASYAHTRLRPIHGPNKTVLATFFEEYFALPGNSPKRLRALGMLREPMNLRASTQAMAMCSLNGKVNTFNWHRERKGLKRICTPEEGLNISELVDDGVEKAMKKCPNGTRVSDTTKMDKLERILCNRGRSALDFCRSPTHLLSSIQYKSSMRSMLKGLMGRFTAREGMAFHDYRSVELFLNRTGVGFSADSVEEYTLVDLGGLDPNMMHTAYEGYDAKQLGSSQSKGAGVSNDAEPDFLWFGITERMKESVCLLFHTLNVEPLPETPRERVMRCSPTSWWTEEHREKVKRMEVADYAVWRAANAILDARMFKLRETIRQNMDSDRRYKALADAGCLD